MEDKDGPLSILHVTDARGFSGGVRQLVLLCAGLQAAGHRAVLCTPPGSSGERLALEYGVPVRALPLGRGGLLDQWRASREVRRIASDLRPDVVHSHHTKGHNVALLATFGGDFPPVVVKRGVLYRPKFPWKFRTGRVRAIICNTNAVKNVLVRSGVTERKIEVIYTSRELPDLEAIRCRLSGLRSELRLEDASPVIGTVGSGKPEKGFQFLVEAAPAILREYPRAAFVLVGSGTEHLLARIDALAGPLCEALLHALVERVPRAVAICRFAQPIRTPAAVMLVEALDVTGRCLRHEAPLRHSAGVACFSAQRSIHSRRRRIVR
jgi:glycosyltransferase involved in cell wall biosynthesis